jgi:hypothetical protein
VYGSESASRYDRDQQRARDCSSTTIIHHKKDREAESDRDQRRAEHTSVVLELGSPECHYGMCACASSGCVRRIVASQLYAQLCWLEGKHESSSVCCLKCNDTMHFVCTAPSSPKRVCAVHIILKHVTSEHSVRLEIKIELYQG